MNIINEERAEILTNNNNGQQSLENFMKDIESNNITEVVINIPLYGTIDLSFMEDDKYKYMRTLIFSEGKITDLIHVPRNITKLIIAKNLLIELNDLPSSLYYLNFSENYLKNIDLTRLNSLETLHGEKNHLETIKLSGESMQSLFLQFNQLKELDVKDFRELRELNVSNNPLIIVKNAEKLPLLTEYISDNNHISKMSTPIIDVNDEKEKVELIDYSIALNKYFSLKSRYESETKELLTKGDNPRCLKCKKKGGSLFSNKDMHYSLMCGNKNNPCSLKIKLFRGDFEQFETIIKICERTVQQDKNDIIIQKLDSLFNYKSAEESVARFKELLEIYNENNMHYTNLLKDYNDIYHNEERLSKIKKINNEIYKVNQELQKAFDTYSETNNKEILKEAMSKYVNDLMPEVHNLQKTKYEVSEIETIKLSENVEIYRLHQYEKHISNLFSIFSESPKVIAYNI
jgi:hypothetical protein